MVLLKSIKLNTNLKHHAYVALFISLWLVIFLIIIAPFDVADLPFVIRLQILPFYGVVSFFSYILLIPIQNWVFNSLNKWTILFEIVFFIVFHIVTLVGCYLYYKTGIINGTFPFFEFVFQIFYPIFFLLLTLILIARWYVNQKLYKDASDKIIITGDNKQDVLKIKLLDLVCIVSADNYVEVNFLNDNELKKKLLRSTLKKMSDQIPDLVKVHRSYLINPIHFIEWKNTKTIVLTQMEVPIAKNYKGAILSLKNSSQKH